jgi:hypothetical protein
MNEHGDLQGILRRLKRKMAYPFKGFYTKEDDIHLAFVIDWIEAENESMFTAFSGHMVADKLQLKWMLTYESQIGDRRPLRSVRTASGNLCLTQKEISPDACESQPLLTTYYQSNVKL